jgi:bifunctional non-homologous end joining protein LigD
MSDADFRPQLATLVKSPPAGDRWLHEIKYDGYRIGCLIDKKGVRLISRNGHDWTHVFPSIADAAKKLPTHDTVIDGEVAMVMEDGRTSFEALQQAAAGSASHAPLVYFVFDLIRLDGKSLVRLPLEERKALLRALVEPASPKPKAGLASPKPKAEAGRIRYAEHIVGGGEKLYEHASKIGLEGIISKRRDLPYHPGRHDSWQKTKVSQHGAFVVGGFTEPEGTRAGFGALLVGAYEGPRLVYAGRVGTGFSHAFAIELRQRLEAIEQPECPFDPPVLKGPERHAHWVMPTLVCGVRYTEWTNEGRLRHPAFEGLRKNVKPRDVKKPTLTISSFPRRDQVRAAGRTAGSPRR